jgi:AMMECR1 domain-containing protein
MIQPTSICRRKITNKVRNIHSTEKLQSRQPTLQKKLGAFTLLHSKPDLIFNAEREGESHLLLKKLKKPRKVVTTPYIFQLAIQGCRKKNL